MGKYATLVTVLVPLMKSTIKTVLKIVRRNLRMYGQKPSCRRWCVVCGVWCAVCGMRCAVCGVRSAVRGAVQFVAIGIIILHSFEM